VSQAPSLPGEGKEAGDSGRELSRDLGFFAVFATATGTMIGAGIFVLPGVAAAGAGPGASLSFLIAGLITCIAAMSVSELATAMPKAGGDYYFVSRASGPLVGTMVGMGAWLALVLKGSFALVGLGQYVLHFSPVPILATAAAAGIGLTVVNMLGAKASGVLQNIIVVALLGIMVLFAVVGLGAVDRTTLEPALPYGWSGVFSTVGVVFISYLGVMKAAAISEEVEDPGRNIPLGILASVLTVTVLYVLTMVIVTGVLPLEQVVAAPAPLADAAGLFLGVAGGAVVAVAGLLATLSTGNAALLSSSRYPFAMARDGLMTEWISQIHTRFRTPVRSILVTGIIMTSLALLLDVEGLAKLGGAFGLLVFALVNLSVLILRRAQPAWYRPAFKVPLYPVLPAVGVIAALAPLPGMGLLSHVSAAGLGIGATLWYFWRKKRVDAEGSRLQPEYGLADRLQELRQVQSLEEKKAALAGTPPDTGPTVEGVAPEEDEPVRVVVEIVADRPYKQLLGLAAAFGSRYESPVDAVTITEVPYQSPLASNLPPISASWLAKLRARMEDHGVRLRFHQVMARDRARAILAFAEPDVKIVLLDWHREFRRSKLLGSYVDTVLRDSPTRVAVLKYRGHRKYEKILVATAGSPYATAEVELADAVAGFTGATLTFMMVLPPDVSEAREEQAREYLKRLDELTDNDAELHLVRGENVADAIVATGRDHDLIVLGSTREVNLRNMFGRFVVGEIADQVAERSEGSVLITKDPRATRRISSRLVQWLSMWSYRLTGRRRPRRPTVVEPEQEEHRVHTFPREPRRR
jgi:amino acid transporter/nucleotide-binding universal stress UspA family protein